MWPWPGRPNNRALISAGTRSYSLLQCPDRLWGLLRFLLNSYRGSLISSFFVTYWIYKNCPKWDSLCLVNLLLDHSVWSKSAGYFRHLFTDAVNYSTVASLAKTTIALNYTMVRELQILKYLEQNGRGLTLSITSPYDGRDCGKP